VKSGSRAPQGSVGEEAQKSLRCTEHIRVQSHLHTPQVPEELETHKPLHLEANIFICKVALPHCRTCGSK
jgi:hypothetical protein